MPLSPPPLSPRSGLGHLRARGQRARLTRPSRGAPFQLGLQAAVLLAAGLACAAPASSPPARASSASPAASSADAPEAPAVPRAASSPAIAAPPPAAGCGPFECRWFDGGAEALRFLLEAESPLALGVGEAHALAGSEHLESTARRFAETLLPELRGRASHLVVELLSPKPGCEAAAREVEREQAPVTAGQATHNQSDYVALGQRARELGVEPFVLSPTCEELRAIAEAGDAAIERMLATIARVTSRMLRAALAKNGAAGRDALVVGYGGALHNDIEPAPAKADWSYAPDLVAFTRGRYVELDLVVRELIKDSDVWRALPWYAHFEPAREPGRHLLMRTAAQRYVLFFPKSRASRGASGTKEQKHSRDGGGAW